LRRDLHGTDVVLGVFDGRPALAAHQQMFLEHRRVGPAQRIHDVGFGDRVELSWAAITMDGHALLYGDDGAVAKGPEARAGAIHHTISRSRITFYPAGPWLATAY
jgi:hypothetical protein